MTVPSAARAIDPPRAGFLNLQVGHQRPQLAEGGGLGYGAHPLAVLFGRQLPVAERRVEHLAGVVAVAVGGPGVGADHEPTTR